MMNLTYEQDAGRRGPRRLEELPDFRLGVSADARHELRGRHGQHGDLALARHRVGQQGLAAARRPVEEAAPVNMNYSIDQSILWNRMDIKMDEKQSYLGGSTPSWR